MKSLIQKDRSFCYLCGRNGNGDPLEEHHVFGGPNRKYSEKDGMKVRLCGDRCHRNGPDAVHHNHDTDIRLKQTAQRIWENTYGTREDFMRWYGKNYL